MVGDRYGAEHEGAPVVFVRMAPDSNMFQLQSHRSKNRYALLVSTSGEVSCSCWGWTAHGHCWHSKLLRELKPTLVITS